MRFFVLLTIILFLLNNIYANQIRGQSTFMTSFIFASSYLCALATTVFNRIGTVATINFSTVQVRLLIEGSSYSRAATINFSAVQVRLLIEDGSYSMAATINFVPDFF